MRAVLALGLLAGCLEPSLVECPGDVLCPSGDVCDTVHGGCVTEGQAEVCIGVADHERCTSGAIVGYCLDEICIDPGCGNFVVEPGELCDDGDRDDGDGCSATCTSRESCGDGVRDLERDEECDDGNLQSHDGCDSRCLVETATWTTDPIGPDRANPSHTTYDVVHQRMVVVADGFVWGWGGARWEVLASDAPAFTSDYDVVYDPERMSVLVVAAEPPMADILIPDPPRTELYEWKAGVWNHTSLASPPFIGDAALTYDTVRKRVILFGASTGSQVVAASLDVGTMRWSPIPSPAAPPGLRQHYALAFDEARGRVVAVVAGTSTPTATNPVVLEWNGSAWSTSSPALTPVSGWTLIWDPVVQRVLALGGTGSTTADAAARGWNGTAWSALPDIPGDRIDPAAVYDRARSTRVVFGGMSSDTRDDVIEGASTWTAVPPMAPHYNISECAFDPRGREMICTGPAAGFQIETWAWNGTWRRVASGALTDPPTAVAFDPIRGKVVGVGYNGLAEHGPNGWALVSTMAPLFDRASSVTFDPERRELVTLIAPEFGGEIHLVRISESDTLEVVSSPYYESLSFDARNHSIVGLGIGMTGELVGTTWTPIVGPGNGFVAVENSRRGTVEFFSHTGRGVERSGATWSDLAVPPPIPLVATAVYDPVSGDTILLGRKVTSRFLLRRHWESATPFESCASGADADGDGLAACDDPDCWPGCTPACPPLATCP